MSARIRERHWRRAQLVKDRVIQSHLGNIEVPEVTNSALAGMAFPPSRHVLGRFLNEHNLLGEGAEIGVLHGSLSLIIMQSWNGQCLHLIDPWCRQDPEIYTEPTNDQDWGDNLRVVRQRMEPFGSRVNIVQSLSKEASKQFKTGQLDWVYIDANHKYENVLEDLMAWAPKVKSGGLISGHDYGDNDVCPVKKAVDSFLKKTKIGPISGLSQCSSFWLWKP